MRIGAAFQTSFTTGRTHCIRDASGVVQQLVDFSWMPLDLFTVLMSIVIDSRGLYSDGALPMAALSSGSGQGHRFADGSAGPMAALGSGCGQAFCQ